MLLPPNEPILGNDNTSPICSPNGVCAAQAAFAPRVANAKFFVSSDEWYVWKCEQPVSNMKHNQIRDQFEALRRQQNVQLVRSKRARDFMSFESSQCTAEGQQFPKMKIQGLYVFLVNGTVPTCKACNR